MQKIKKQSRKPKTTNKKPYLMGLILVLAFVVSSYVLFFKAEDGIMNTELSRSSESTSNFENEIDYNPATEEEKNEVVQNKKDLGNEEPSEMIQPGEMITPTVTFANVRGANVEVRSFIGSIYESGGVCTATFTKNDEKLEKTVNAQKDVSYTRCETAALPVEDFSSGIWTVFVKYQSDNYQGTSESVEIEIL